MWKTLGSRAIWEATRITIGYTIRYLAILHLGYTIPCTSLGRMQVLHVNGHNQSKQIGNDSTDTGSAGWTPTKMHTCS